MLKDYELADLPSVDERNVIVIRNFTSKLWEDRVNQVRVKFTDRAQDYKDGTAMVQDMANINAQGRVRSITNAYPGIMANELSVDVATRDLSQSSEIGRAHV